MVAALRMSDFDGYMTLPQIAERIGVKTTGGLRSQIVRGRLKAHRVGRDWLVANEEAERFIREHSSKPGPRPKVVPPPDEPDAE